jgi:DNA polymerase
MSGEGRKGRIDMSKEKALRKIAAEIDHCRSCKKGCSGKAVPGEGSAGARVVFIGEAPGHEEAKTGRPFIGRSGKLLRQAIQDMGLDVNEVFITSPVHYLPDRGTPSKDMILHGREHLFQQLAVIDPDIIVLLGATACRAVLDRKVEVAKLHGSTARSDRRACFITFHPAYAIRFTEGKRLFLEDFTRLKRLVKALR